MNNRQVYR